MTRQPDHKPFPIFGAGLAGSLLAVYLARAGRRVDLYERRPDPRAHGAAGGRSINLALSTRGVTALEGVGLAQRVLHDAIPMRGRMIHGVDGSLAFQPYTKNPKDAILSISREGLNLALVQAAAAEPLCGLRFSRRLVDVDLGAARASVFNAETKREEPVDCTTVIGADGAFSAVRHSMMMRSDRFEYSQSYLTHGYKELTIPPAEGGGHRLEKHALHIWPRGTYMLIALPNADGSFTATLFLPYAGTHGDASRPGFDDLITRQRVLDFFERTFRDALARMPTLGEDFFTRPTGSLVTVRCFPWRDGDRALLIGDAAHAVVPFYGQGMNAAFEDCRVLAELLARTPSDVAHAFGAFEQQRRPSADALADLALHNFVEMRDLAGKRWFRWKKRLERTAARLFPRAFTPLYTMVTFTNIPYEQAVARARRQDRAVLALTLALAAAMLLALVWLLDALL